MIDFRYHIVSIVGIFLALAIGLVLGTTTLDPVLTHNLSSNVKTLTADKQSLRDQLSTTQQDLSQAGAFISAVEKPLIANRLTGHKVLVIAAPNAPSSLRGKMTKAIADAGGVVSGQIGINADYLDPVNETRLGDVVNSVAPGTVTLPTGGRAGQRAAQLLASLLVSKTPSETADPQTTAALLALSQAKFLHLISAQDTQADLVLVISDDGSADKPSPTPSAATAPSLDPLLDLVGTSDTAGSGVVIAGSSNVAKGSLLSAVRASGTSDAVSSVDAADSAQGTVQVVYALAAQLRGESGSYGSESGSDLPLPTPAP